MFFLISAVIASVSVAIFLKLARKQEICIEQAILINYVCAILWCLVLLKPDFANVVNFDDTTKNLIIIGLGVLLPSIFVVMSKAVEIAGIVKSDAAQRLSLFIPIISAFLLFGEVLTTPKTLGIVLAFVALSLIVYRPSNHHSSQSQGSSFMILLGVWLGYGVIDVLFKQMSKLGNAFADTLFLSFVLAWAVMLVFLLIKKTKWHAKSLFSGIILGSLNFANILFYIKAHQAFKEDPTLVFAGMNIGVISLGALVGLFVFKEKVSKINLIGILVGIAAIFCLFYLDKLMA